MDLTGKGERERRARCGVELDQTLPPLWAESGMEERREARVV